MVRILAFQKDILSLSSESRTTLPVPEYREYLRDTATALDTSDNSQVREIAGVLRSAANYDAREVDSTIQTLDTANREKFSAVEQTVQKELDETRRLHDELRSIIRSGKGLETFSPIRAQLQKNTLRVVATTPATDTGDTSLHTIDRANSRLIDTLG